MGDWGDFMNDPNFKQLIQTAEEKLAKAAQSFGKGKGKVGSAWWGRRCIDNVNTQV